MPERYLGKTLGKYRVDELVGSGGFAWVYKGYDPELDIPVALKVLKPQFAGDPTFEERFRREASTAAKLRHPGIIKIYAVGRDGDAVYFVMDFLPTGLADKLETSPSLPEEFVVRVGIDVARALGFAHREGVIHRDIKVDNILFDPHGNAVVADFGIARAVTGYANQTGTNMVVGTPQYFAPEQARAKPLDGRADIYSLGVSLYRAATGRLPFEGDDWYEIARQHVEEAPPPPRSINPAISPAFERVLLRCLAKHPDDRPATGEQLADELSVVLAAAQDTSGSRSAYRAASDTPTLITPVAADAVRTPTRGGRRWSAPLTLAAVLALAIIGMLFARSWRSDTAAADSGAVKPGDSTQVAAAAIPTPIDTSTAPRDSAVVDTTPAVVAPPKRDSTPPRPVTGKLIVAAPPGARVTLNRTQVSEGAWRNDTLKPGDYVLAASINAIDGCETARVEERVRVKAGSSQTVTLQPRACGTLFFALPGETAMARWTVVGESGFRREGTGPMTDPLVVPVGTYTVQVQQAQCADYARPDLKVEADTPQRFTVKLLCGK